MACGLPLILSDFEYWKESFSGCALFVNPFDPEDIASKINMLIEKPGLRQELGKAAKKKVNSEYSWEEESKKLIEFYSKI